MARWVQKIVMNGSSAQVTICRELMYRLDLRPGFFVEITHEDGSDTFSVREWATRENRGTRTIGKIVDHPAVRS